MFILDIREHHFITQKRFFLILVFVFLLAPTGIASENGILSNGFGEKITWKSWADALLVAKETEKPIMVILHKDSCPACKAFKPVFAKSNEISELSSQFVMVNAKFGQVPSAEPKLNLDGKYVPRIIFLDSQSNVLQGVTNKHGNPKFKYFHQTAETVIQAMKSALEITSVITKSDVVPSTEL